MRQATIDFTAQQVQARVSLGDRVRELYRSVNGWLDTESRFYSRVADFSVTRRTAVRVNLVTVAIGAMVVAAETQPVAALTAALSVAWLMYRAMMKSDDNNQTDGAGEEGGRR